jgi:Arc/MetJ family transcription regulator
MGRATVTVDDSLLVQAQEALGTATKSETVRIALEEVVRRRRLEEVLEHQGRIELDLDQEKLAKLRQER